MSPGITRRAWWGRSSSSRRSIPSQPLLRQSRHTPTLPSWSSHACQAATRNAAGRNRTSEPHLARARRVGRGARAVRERHRPDAEPGNRVADNCRRRTDRSGRRLRVRPSDRRARVRRSRASPRQPGSDARHDAGRAGPRSVDPEDRRFHDAHDREHARHRRPRRRSRKPCADRGDRVAGQGCGRPRNC